MRLVFLYACLLPALFGQSFEVASVRPNPPRPGQFIIPRYPNGPVPHLQGNRYRSPYATVEDLVMQAYGMNDYQIEGLPPWGHAVVGDHFDIEAEVASGASTDTATLQRMLQSLLAERFALKLHRENRELPVYLLKIDKGGVKMRSLRDDEVIPTYSSQPPESATTLSRYFGIFSLIRRVADRPVIDQTGLSGRFEARSFPSAELARLNREDPAAAQTRLLQWLQELGLKFEARKQMTEVLKIDHVAQPSDN